MLHQHSIVSKSIMHNMFLLFTTSLSRILLCCSNCKFNQVLSYMSIKTTVCAAMTYGSYFYNTSVCYTTSSSIMSVSNTSLANCKYLCNSYMGTQCNALFWLRPNGTCLLTSYTGNNVTSTCQSSDDWMYLRRLRQPCQCLIEYIKFTDN
jgi:hypothetical protein